jgi:hypothetical protein
MAPRNKVARKMIRKRAAIMRPLKMAITPRMLEMMKKKRKKKRTISPAAVAAAARTMSQKRSEDFNLTKINRIFRIKP